MGDSDLRAFEYVARRLGERKIAFLCAREYVAPTPGSAAQGGVRRRFITNEKFTYESAERAIEAGDADAVAFGCYRQSDLPQRFALQAPLNEPRVAEFYSGGAQAIRTTRRFRRRVRVPT